MNNQNNINVLVVTHNSRLRCFLSKIQGGAKILRFKNCAILKIVITPQRNEYNIELFYEGEKGSGVDKLDDKFYGINLTEINGGFIRNFLGLNKKKQQPEKTEKEAQPFTAIHIEYNKINNLINLGHDTITLYVVRHAEGDHNKKTNKYKGWINRLTSILQIPLHIDPPLSPEGNNQAKNAGTFLAKPENGIKFNYAFTSELKRTRETAINILDTILQQNITLYPIPCIHEVSNYAKGLCDDFKLNSNLIRAPENKSKCFKYKNHTGNFCTHHTTDWRIYQKLNNKCTGTDLVHNVLNALLFAQQIQTHQIQTQPINTPQIML